MSLRNYKSKSNYDPRKVEKNYRKYGHKDAFSGSNASKQYRYRLQKQAAERRVVQKQRKKPQTKRGFVSATLDAFGAPQNAVTTAIYNKITGKKKSVWQSAKEGFTAMMPGSGRANEYVSWGKVYNAGHEQAHKRGINSAWDNMVKYEMMNAGVRFTDLGGGKYRDAQGNEKYYNPKGQTNVQDVYGVASDFVLDPLNLVGGGLAKGTGKILKGSGASLSRLKQIGGAYEGIERVSKATDEAGHVIRTAVRPGDTAKEIVEGVGNKSRTIQAKKTRDVLQIMYSDHSAKQRAEILSGVSDEGVYKRLRSNKSYDNYDDDALRTIAKDTADTFRSTYMHTPTPKDKIDVALGLKNKPFGRMRSLALNARIEGDQALRKIGDYTIAPYYNEFTQKLRASRIGRAFSNANHTESNIRHNYAAANNYAGLFAIKGKQGLADVNVEVMEKADKFLEQWNSLSPEQQLQVRSAIENGDLKRANEYFTFEEKAGVGIKKGSQGKEDVDVNKTIKGIQDKVQLFKDDKREAEQVLELLENQGKHNFTPAQYLFYRVNNRMPDLATKDKDVIDIYNLMLLDRRYQDLDIPKTFLNAYNNVMDMHAEGIMGRLDTNVRKGVKVLSDGGVFSRIGLARRQLESGTADVAQVFDDLVRYLGAEDTYNLIKDNAVFASDVKTRLAYDQASTLSKNVPEGLYVNPVTSHSLNMLKKRESNEGSALSRAYNALRDTFIKATVTGNHTIDGYKEAGDIVALVDDKLAKAAGSGKDFTLQDVLLDLDEEIREGIIDAYMDTAQGHLDIMADVSGTSLFDRYKYLRDLDDKGSKYYRNQLEYANKMKNFRDVLSPAENEFLDSIGVMESIINPNAKNNGFSYSLEQAGEALDKLHLYEQKYNELRKAAEIFDLDSHGNMYDLARGFTDEMNRIGRAEVEVGELAEEQFKKYQDRYIRHSLTDEAKRYNNIRDVEFEKNGAFSDVFSRGGNFASSRTSNKTIDEMNKAMGFEYFKTNLVDLYLERALQSNRLIYADESTRYLFDKFSKPLAKLIGGNTNLSSGVDGKHTLAIPFNALDRVVNKVAGRGISSEAYKWAEEAASTYESNLLNKNTLDSVNRQIEEVTNIIKDNDRDIELFQKEYGDSFVCPFESDYLEALDNLNQARRAEEAGTTTHDVVDALSERFEKIADEREDWLLQNNEEYNVYHDMITSKADIESDLKALNGVKEKSRLEYEKTLGALEDNNVTRLPHDMTHKDLVEAYKNIWMKEHGNELFRDRKNSVVDNIFGSADDKDRKIAQRRQLYATNIPVQTLTDEQANVIRALYDKDEDFFRDICQFDNDVLDKVNIMSRSQELAGMNAILKVFDNFMLQYKRLNTLVDLSFHVQNGLSNAFQSFMGSSVAAFDPVSLKRSYNILKARPEDAAKTINLGGKNYSYRQLYEYMKQFGVIDESFTRYEMLGGNTDQMIHNIRQSPAIKNIFKDAVYPWNVDEDATKFEKAMSFNPGSWYMQWSGNVGSNLETTQRANLFLNALEQGQSLSDAVKTVNKYMFDYGDLTKFERDWLKRAIPFYTFMRKNIPMELETMLTQPKKFSAISHLEQELNNEQEDSILPNWRNQWRQNYFQIPGLGDGQWGVDPKLPYEQLDRLDPQLMENGWEPKALGRLAGSTNPLLKALIELPTGTNQYVDMSLDENKDGMDKGDYLKYLLGMTIPTKLYSELKGYEEQQYDDKRFNDQVKDATSHLAFPVGHISDMAEFKKYELEGTNRETGEKFNYRSYLSQDEMDELYKNTYLKWEQEEHDREQLRRSSAYDAEMKWWHVYHKGEPKPSFKEWQTRYYGDGTYESYVEYCKQNGFPPKSKKDWKKYETYTYVDQSK